MSDVQVIEVEYCASDTGRDFHNCNDWVRLIVGPVGSGKSVMSVEEIQLRAEEVPPMRDGIRRSRCVVIRNSYRELMDTTINTFKQWTPDEICTWLWKDMKCTIAYNDVECEVLFRSLDKPGDVGKLLSLELTFGFINEAREVPYGLIEVLQTRLGRYPAKKDVPKFWYGLWMDTNPMDEDSRMYQVFEELKPAGHRVFRQPGGMIKRGDAWVPNPKAENVDNLPEGYYERMISGKTNDFISVYVGSLYGFVSDGKPIFPEYNDLVHCANEEIPYTPDVPIVLGQDYGLTPACVFLQQINGSWYAIDEIATEDTGAEKFGGLVLAKLNGEYSQSTVTVWGDPSGDQRSPIRESESVFQILNDMGIPAEPAYSGPGNTDDPLERREAVAKNLTRLGIDGRPRLMISTKCKKLRKGLRGGYCYKRLQVAGADRFQDKPDKNIYSHVCEALEYAMVGEGEGSRIPLPTPSRAAQRKYKVKGSLR